MSTSSSNTQRVRRPVCATKNYLINHFGVSYKVLWSTIVTDDLLEEWGYDYQRDIKKGDTLDPNLTRKIYAHYGMGVFEDELPTETDQPRGNRAPPE